MTEDKNRFDPLEYGSVDRWDEFAENMEPEWEKAHKPRPKTEVLTIRLSAADMKRLKVFAEQMGIGHSTLARMILRKALHHGDASFEEAAASTEQKRWVQIL